MMARFSAGPDLNSSHLDFHRALPQAVSLSGPSPPWRVRLGAALRRVLRGCMATGGGPDADATQRALFLAHAQPMWVFERSTQRVMDVNDAAIRHFGYSRDEFLAMTARQIRRDSQLEPAPRAQTDAATCILVCKDGRLVEAQLGSFQLVYRGKAACMVLVNDVTQLRNLERELKAARAVEALAQAQFEAMAEGVLLIDSDQRINRMNDALVQLSGYARTELMQMTLNQLLEPAARPLGEGMQAMPWPEGAQLSERELRRKAGRPVAVEISMRPVHDGCSVLVLRDITERRKAERAARNHKSELSGLTLRLLTQERETTRYIAQTLHDHLGQHLALARLHLDASVAVHSGTMSAALHQDCLQLGSSLDRAMGDVRAVLHELRPALLEEQGLIAALDNEVRARTFDTTQPDVLLELDDGDLALRWPPEVEYAAFMIAREAIVNAQQRSGTTLVRVVLAGDAQGLQLEIIDDGRVGTGPLQPPAIGHIGLVGMRERAVAIGGQFAAEYNAKVGNSVMLLWLEGRP
jgi:PAS domain S-box-containing protein